MTTHAGRFWAEMQRHHEMAREYTENTRFVSPNSVTRRFGEVTYWSAWEASDEARLAYCGDEW